MRMAKCMYRNSKVKLKWQYKQLNVLAFACRNRWNVMVTKPKYSSKPLENMSILNRCTNVMQFSKGFSEWFSGLMGEKTSNNEHETSINVWPLGNVAETEITTHMKTICFGIWCHRYYCCWYLWQSSNGFNGFWFWVNCSMCISVSI